MKTRIAETGCGHPAIFEVATGEPHQFLVQGSSPEKMQARWEEILEMLDRKAKGE